MKCSHSPPLRRSGRMFILNTSDHIRNGKVQQVTDWHLSTASSLGFEMIDRIEVPTPRMRNGANSSARIEKETVAVLTPRPGSR